MQKEVARQIPVADDGVELIQEVLRFRHKLLHLEMKHEADCNREGAIRTHPILGRNMETYITIFHYLLHLLSSSLAWRLVKNRYFLRSFVDKICVSKKKRGLACRFGTALTPIEYGPSTETTVSVANGSWCCTELSTAKLFTKKTFSLPVVLCAARKEHVIRGAGGVIFHCHHDRKQTRKPKSKNGRKWYRESSQKRPLAKLFGCDRHDNRGIRSV